jgi:uncharacterized GH25 family protein
MIPRLLFALIVLTISALPALSHEFWIKPQNYQVESGASIVADLMNGENFEGSPQVFFQSRTARSELIQRNRTTLFTGRMGDVPAIQMEVPDEGLAVFLHQTRPATLKYKNWEKFADFAKHKDFPDIRARQKARGLPEQDFFETYTRYAKALIAVGHARGQDAPTGMDTEFVALSNPYVDDVSVGFPVQLMYRGDPRPDAQIEVFDRAPDGQVSISLIRTNALGQATVPVTPGHEYLLDAVILRPAPDGQQAVWESLWAAMTFLVP